MAFARRTLALSEAVSRLAIRVGGGLIILISLLITVEIVLRKTMNLSTGGADELSGYAMAIGFSWALSHTLHQRAHVRIDVLYTRVRPAPRAWLDCLGMVCLAVFSVTLTYFCWRVVQDSVQLGGVSNTTLAIPLWIPQGLWLLGMLLFSFSSLLLCVLSLHALVTGDRARVFALAGSRTTDDELSLLRAKND